MPHFDTYAISRFHAHATHTHTHSHMIARDLLYTCDLSDYGRSYGHFAIPFGFCSAEFRSATDWTLCTAFWKLFTPPNHTRRIIILGLFECWWDVDCRAMLFIYECWMGLPYRGSHKHMERTRRRVDSLKRRMEWAGSITRSLDAGCRWGELLSCINVCLTLFIMFCERR